MAYRPFPSFIFCVLGLLVLSSPGTSQSVGSDLAASEPPINLVGSRAVDKTADVSVLRIHNNVGTVDLEYATVCWVTSFQDTAGCGRLAPVIWRASCNESWLSTQEILLVRQETLPFGCVPFNGTRQLLYIEQATAASHALALYVVGLGGTDVASGEHREFLFDSVSFAEKVTVIPAIPTSWGRIKSRFTNGD